MKSRENTADRNRFAIIISNQAVKGAVRRHFFKRFFARRLAKWPNKGEDCVIICSPRLEATNAKVLDADIKAALEELLTKHGTII